MTINTELLLFHSIRHCYAICWWKIDNVLLLFVILILHYLLSFFSPFFSFLFSAFPFVTFTSFHSNPIQFCLWNCETWSLHSIGFVLVKCKLNTRYTHTRHAMVLDVLYPIQDFTSWILSQVRLCWYHKPMYSVLSRSSLNMSRTFFFFFCCLSTHLVCVVSSSWTYCPCKHQSTTNTPTHTYGRRYSRSSCTHAFSALQRQPCQQKKTRGKYGFPCRKMHCRTHTYMHRHSTPAQRQHKACERDVASEWWVRMRQPLATS